MFFLSPVLQVIFFFFMSLALNFGYFFFLFGLIPLFFNFLLSRFLFCHPMPIFFISYFLL
ncbi:MAG: hypothetical protein AUJ31_01035 [Parcubacteria group bacterium CG1_02_39_15]|uniref:Uncharacterized protein n=2 Tax=Candidatus Nealsoniibacteriota TaxID=1817911 RepID=A0A2H0MP21_9BACT|nr:MAG: hypothetical protein AUJ31_01035 [Parcubacteria group bacterium CG1_02_39_15]PIQ98402.1 MAG: hypothetical protein COV64_01500 [Candidatus Nealsonbacteria bacterium CG11_big_fil_rev_8_21_14_0_20_39_9]PIZ88261.1 MAG: hypothetical protein COX91_01100 [Candidatus Nealsonbacteria bacterium CG_4_10_14_0_2_um_filter_39_15]